MVVGGVLWTNAKIAIGIGLGGGPGLNGPSSRWIAAVSATTDPYVPPNSTFRNIKKLYLSGFQDQHDRDKGFGEGGRSACCAARARRPPTPRRAPRTPRKRPENSSGTTALWKDDCLLQVFADDTGVDLLLS